MTNVIIFIDALSPRELNKELESHYQGDMDSGVPRVTPKVMSEIYTGKDISENGMLEKSMYEGDTSRPTPSTFIDQCVREGMSVLSMNMPYCIPFRDDNDESLLHGTSAQQNMVNRENESIHVFTPPPQKDMINDSPEEMFGSARDQTIRMISGFKENLRKIDPEVAFLGYRLIDSYCHFQHTEEHNGKTHRKRLIELVSDFISDIETLIDGDVLWFSDHGQTKLTDTFRINRWLRDNGYLEYSVDENFLETVSEHQMAEQHPVDVRVENQTTIGQPGVKFEESESQIICSDPYDSCLTLLCDREEFDEEQFREDLMDTGMYRDVTYRWEKFSDDSPFYEKVPHVLPDREKGVFVSGSVHPKPVGMGWYRTGVHDRIGCYGATRQLNSPNETIFPVDMHDIITDFIGLEVTKSPVDKTDLQAMSTDERSALEKDIEEVF